MEVREPAAAYGHRKYTIEEYLEIENASEEKHEYYLGEIFAMSGARPVHVIIRDNIIHALLSKLTGKPCQPYGSDLRIHIPNNTLFTYPDVSVVCGDLETWNNDDFNVLNPTIVIEVLSASTRRYDRGEKFRLYKDIATLKEYILIDSESIAVEVWVKNNGGEWLLTEIYGISLDLDLRSIEVAIPLMEIYDRTKLIP